MEQIVSSETSAIRTQTPGNYPKRNKLHLEHGESLKTKIIHYFSAQILFSFGNNLFHTSVFLCLFTVSTKIFGRGLMDKVLYAEFN